MDHTSDYNADWAREQDRMRAFPQDEQPTTCSKMKFCAFAGCFVLISRDASNPCCSQHSDELIGLRLKVALGKGPKVSDWHCSPGHIERQTTWHHKPLWWPQFLNLLAEDWASHPDWWTWQPDAAA